MYKEKYWLGQTRVVNSQNEKPWEKKQKVSESIRYTFSVLHSIRSSRRSDRFTGQKWIGSNTTSNGSVSGREVDCEDGGEGDAGGGAVGGAIYIKK